MKLIKCSTNKNVNFYFFSLTTNALNEKQLIYHDFVCSPTPVISHMKKVSYIGIIWLSNSWRDMATRGWEEFVCLHPLPSKRDRSLLSS